MTSTDFDRDVIENESIEEIAKHDAARVAALNRPAEGPTLLWSVPAKLITTVAGIASLSIRTGAKIGGWGVTAGKESTLRILRANQLVAETILYAAGRDLSKRPDERDYAAQQAESIIERWVSTIHSGITAASILTAAAFNVTQYGINTTEHSMTRGLAFLNAVFGSTESSRAVAAIMTLIRTELEKPGIDGRDQQPGVLDLLIGITGFVLLQRHFKKQTEIEFRNANGEATIWDVVIDDKGFRADVLGVTRRMTNVQALGLSPTETVPQASTTDVAMNEDMFASASPNEHVYMTDEEIQQRIMAQLPHGFSATITSETTLTKNVRVDIHGSDTINLEPPPGMTMVSEDLSPSRSGPNNSFQSVVFRTASKAASQADVQPRLLPTAPTANQKKSRKPAPPETNSPPTERHSKLPIMKSRGQGTKSSIKKMVQSAIPQTAAAAYSKRQSNRRDNAMTNIVQPMTQDDSIFQLASNQTTPATTPGSVTPIPMAYETPSGAQFTVHKRRRESIHSQTDSISIYSNDSRPPSPTMSRTQLRGTNSIFKTQSHTEVRSSLDLERRGEGSLHHQRSRSFVPSLYSMGSRNPEDETLILQARTPVIRQSIFEDDATLTALASDGKVPGQFPDRHFLWTLQRFARFASASYGSNFLRFMGLSSNHESSMSTELAKMDVHAEHTSFSTYTGLPTETIVKSSFVDEKGISSANSSSFSPLIHFISIDLESKAIVLTCRGTLGFEDMLTDMTCGYDDLYWQGQTYKVHQGVRDSARRLLDSANGSRVMATLKECLDQYPEFGLVLCGHSLGGAVAALLGIMIAEPSRHEPNRFVTAQRPKLLASAAQSSKETIPITLPAGRSVHVYAYGSPAIVSPALRLATRGFVTTTVTANDVVPSLSLGNLHDFRAMTNHIKSNAYGGLSKLTTRVSDQIRSAVASYIFPESDPSHNTVFPPTPQATSNPSSDWAWHELLSLRSTMTAEKLLPPGEIFILESTRVFDRQDIDPRDPFNTLGRPATRVQLKYIRDVEKRFAEVRFGRTMFWDHSPGRYEEALSALERGVLEE